MRSESLCPSLPFLKRDEMLFTRGKGLERVHSILDFRIYWDAHLACLMATARW